jgi:hypothetical protein
MTAAELSNEDRAAEAFDNEVLSEKRRALRHIVHALARRSNRYAVATAYVQALKEEFGERTLAETLQNLSE